MGKYLLVLLVCYPCFLHGLTLYRMERHTSTHWASFENIRGAKGNGGKRDEGAKGHTWDVIRPGEAKEILSVTGIRRIWMTVSDKSPAMLRSLRIDMYRDGNAAPAVSAPLGDFFGDGLGVMVPFEIDLIADPGGRYFVCDIPMSFRKGARVVITNDSSRPETRFYDIDYLKVKKLPTRSLYFHAYWSDNSDILLGKDFDILPGIKGEGRFLGASFGIITDSSYRQSWWEEGEMKVYLDGDSTYPSLVGTGTEDYLGSGSGLGTFMGKYQGCLVADDRKCRWAFYRFHAPDPIFIHRDIRVNIQGMGADSRDNVRSLQTHGAKLITVSVTAPDYSRQWNLMEMHPKPSLMDKEFPVNWVNFYRKDNFRQPLSSIGTNPVEVCPRWPRLPGV